MMTLFLLNMLSSVEWGAWSNMYGLTVKERRKTVVAYLKVRWKIPGMTKEINEKSAMIASAAIWIPRW